MEKVNSMDKFKKQDFANQKSSEMLIKVLNFIQKHEQEYFSDGYSFKEKYKERSKLLEQLEDDEWSVDCAMNAATFQYKFDDSEKDHEICYFIPKVILDMNNLHFHTYYLREPEKEFHKKKLKEPLFSVRTAIGILQPIGFDADGDKIDIVHELYYSKKKIDTGNIFQKIAGYCTQLKWKIKMAMDWRYQYCLLYNLPLNKL